MKKSLLLIMVIVEAILFGWLNNTKQSNITDGEVEIVESINRDYYRNNLK